MLSTKLIKFRDSISKNSAFGYVISIGSTSAFTIIKGFLLAIFLSSDVYGQYVSLYAICIFLGTTLSFGNIESTIKTYPRLHVDEKYEEILSDIFAIIRIIILRSILMIPVIAGLIWYFSNAIDLITVVSCWILTITTAIFTIISSGIRATGLLNYIGKIQLVRSLVSFFIVLVIAQLFKFVPFIFLAEAVASSISVILSIKTLTKSLELKRKSPQEYFKKTPTISGYKEGLPLFFSYILVAIPTFFDKSIIGSTLGFAFAGTFGVISVINQAGTLISNIIVQRVGPQIIKIIKQSTTPTKATTYLIKWVLVFFAVQVLLISGVFVLYNVPYFYKFFQKYNIDSITIILMGLISLLQAKSFVEFFFIAHDKESTILRNAVLYIVLFTCFFAFIIWMKLGFVSFLIGILAAKVIQIVFLSSDYLKLIRSYLTNNN